MDTDILVFYRGTGAYRSDSCYALLEIDPTTLTEIATEHGPRWSARCAQDSTLRGMRVDTFEMREPPLTAGAALQRLAKGRGGRYVVLNRLDGSQTVLLDRPNHARDSRRAWRYRSQGLV